MNRAETSRDRRSSLPYIPAHPLSFQTPPNADGQDQVERLQADLASVTQELNEMKAKARLGDYAGALFNFLEQNSPMTPT